GEVYFRGKICAPCGMGIAGFPISASQKARVGQRFGWQGDGSVKPMDLEMPQRPEFFMGGGALFSTPRNYMAFLQMLLHQGTFNGAQLLKPETGVDAAEPHRRSQRGHVEDDKPGPLERCELVPRQAPEMGTVVRH